MSLDEVVAVRGDRLAPYWIALKWDGGETHRIPGITDDEVQIVERFVSFDDVHLALVVPDEMTRDLERHGPSVSLHIGKDEPRTPPSLLTSRRRQHHSAPPEAADGLRLRSAGHSSRDPLRWRVEKLKNLNFS